MWKSFKIEIFPDADQQASIKRILGVYRYVYNWGIIHCRENYKNGVASVSKVELQKAFSKARNASDDTAKILQQLPCHTGRQALVSLYNAYIKFFRKKGGYPKFKVKKKSMQSFTMDNQPGAFYFKDDVYVKISGVEGFIYCGPNQIPKGLHYYAPTILYDGYRYWLIAKFNYDPVYYHETTDESIGIDLGFRKTMQLSNGKIYKYPTMHKLEKRKRKLQRNLDRRRAKRVRESIVTKTKYEDLPISKSEERIKHRFYKTQQKMNFIRDNFVHQSTTEIVKTNPKRIVVEDLNIQRMLENTAVRFIHHHEGVSFTQILRCLEYKSEERGIEFIRAPKYFPSSQICSCCGKRHKPHTSDMFRCPYCGYIIDRDLNAAINLSRVGV